MNDTPQPPAGPQALVRYPRGLAGFAAGFAAWVRLRDLARFEEADVHVLEIRDLTGNNPDYDRDVVAGPRGLSVVVWLSFFDKHTLPTLLKHIEDCELGRFAMAGTKELIAGLESHPLTFPTWLGLLRDVPQLILDGAVVLRFKANQASRQAAWGPWL